MAPNEEPAAKKNEHLIIDKKAYFARKEKVKEQSLF